MLYREPSLFVFTTAALVFFSSRIIFYLEYFGVNFRRLFYLFDLHALFFTDTARLFFTDYSTIFPHKISQHSTSSTTVFVKLVHVHH